MMNTILSLARPMLVAVASSITLATGPAFAKPEQPIPRSVPGGKAHYFLVDARRTGDIVTAVYKRVDGTEVLYTRTETNCSKMQMRVLGSSDQSPRKIKEKPTIWFDLVAGSSKSDLANFICKR